MLHYLVNLIVPNSFVKRSKYDNAECSISNDNIWLSFHISIIPYSPKFLWDENPKITFLIHESGWLCTEVFIEVQYS